MSYHTLYYLFKKKLPFRLKFNLFFAHLVFLLLKILKFMIFSNYLHCLKNQSNHFHLNLFSIHSLYISNPFLRKKFYFFIPICSFLLYLKYLFKNVMMLFIKFKLYTIFFFKILYVNNLIHHLLRYFQKNYLFQFYHQT